MLHTLYLQHGNISDLCVHRASVVKSSMEGCGGPGRMNHRDTMFTEVFLEDEPCPAGHAVG